MKYRLVVIVQLMTSSDNKSDEISSEIENTAARYAWASYYVFIFISSILGDTTVLIGSLKKYRALRLPKTVVIIIQHIAVCDLLTSLFIILPTTASLIANDWVLGNWLCISQPYIRRHFNGVNSWLICSMIMTKLLVFLYPFRAQSLKSKHIHIGCAFIWSSVAIVPMLQVFEDKRSKMEIFFSHRYHDCNYKELFASMNKFNRLLYLIFLIVFYVLVIAATAYLIVKAHQIAKKGRMSLRWQGLTTTILTATIYCISGLPFVIYFIVGRSNPNIAHHVGFRKLVVASFAVNTISNFYIYCLTVESFRSFVWYVIQYGCIKCGLLSHAGTALHGKMANCTTTLY